MFWSATLTKSDAPTFEPGHSVGLCGWVKAFFVDDERSSSVALVPALSESGGVGPAASEDSIGSRCISPPWN